MAIYDDGGANGNYSSNCNSYLVIYPEQEGSFVQITGTFMSESSSWDYISFYDGVGTGTLIHKTNQTANVLYTIPTITSSSGPITVYFKTDGSGQYAGFELFVSCVTCTAPSFTAYSPSNTEAVVSITSGNDSWDLVYGEHGFDPNEGDGTTVEDLTSPTYTVSDLESGTVYDFYARANCEDGESDWAGPVVVSPGAMYFPTSGETTVSMCGGIIYDDGGADGNYSTNCDATVILNPDQPGMMVHLSGTFSLEVNYDKLYVYDGAGTSGDLLFYSVDDATLDVTSTTGPLTIRFTSDNSVVYPGFEITVSCVEGGDTIPEPSCNAPANVTASNITYNSADIDWTQDGTPDSWTISYKKGSVETWTTVNVTSHPYTITDLESETSYSVKVTANCGENSQTSSTIPFVTLPNGVNEYVNSTVLYPNPTTGQFTILNEQCTIENVEVYDVYGKVLNSVVVNDNKAVLDVAGYASGIYFARIHTDKGVVVKQIVKK